jgi:hypothetical protein
MGTSILFGEAELFGGVCPPTASAHGLLEFDAQTQKLLVMVCAEDQGVCADPNACGSEKYVMAVAGMDLGFFIGQCVDVEASTPLGIVNGQCAWGALTMFPPDNTDIPLALAVTHGAPPTPSVAPVLGDAVQIDPLATCSCAALPNVAACCSEDAEFYRFLLPNGAVVEPPNAVGGLEFDFLPYPYKFHAFSAHQLGTCTDLPEISWGLRADY